MKIRKPLAVRIPGDYAEQLGIHFTTLSKINNGARPMPLDKACLLMVLSDGDPRLKGLHIFDLCPELEIGLPWFCQARARKKRKV